MRKAIEIENLFFSYSDKKNAINNIHLQIDENNKVGIVGSNGSGKTTLFLLMSGVLKPDSGTIRVFNREVKYKSYNQDIGFVFQNPDDQLFSPTVYDDLAFGLLNQGVSKNDVDFKTEKYLKSFGLNELLHRPTQHLSDGEKRKISLLSVTIMEPNLLILDEPSSNLDMKSRREYIDLLSDWDKTLIISSHDLEFILEICPTTILMDSGQVIAVGDSKSILSNEELMIQCHQEIPWSIRRLSG